jgi:hypothetical protein
MLSGLAPQARHGESFRASNDRISLLKEHRHSCLCAQRTYCPLSLSGVGNPLGTQATSLCSSSFAHHDPGWRSSPLHRFGALHTFDVRRSVLDAELGPYRACSAGVAAVSDGDGVVATFFLIRYQSVLASRSEMIFACQFLSISFFIIRALQ